MLLQILCLKLGVFRSCNSNVTGIRHVTAIYPKKYITAFFLYYMFLAVTFVTGTNAVTTVRKCCYRLPLHLLQDITRGLKDYNEKGLTKLNYCDMLYTVLNYCKALQGQKKK